MTVTIAYRPETEKGKEILDQLELRPDQVLEDGTRRYHIDQEVDLHALDPALDRIDSGWRDHVTSLPPDSWTAAGGGSPAGRRARMTAPGARHTRTGNLWSGIAVPPCKTSVLYSEPPGPS